MSDLHAIVLNLIQGATEWLPISSTAHLRVIPALLGWPDPGAAFTAIIQWGTFLAAVLYFWRDIVAILSRPEPAAAAGDERRVDRRLLVPVIVGSVPVVIFGKLFSHAIEHGLRSLYVVAASMMVFAVLLGIAEARHVARRSIGTVTLADGLWVGIGQAFALIPGASRSGTTITAALAVGLERATAARFSFLLSLPAVLLAGAYEMLQNRHEIAASHQARPIVLATIVAFFVGWVSIAWLMSFLKRHPTYVFIVYRLLLGAAILALLSAGRLVP